MKKILYITLVMAGLITSSCSDDLLEQNNLYEKYDVDFYKTPEDVAQALSAAYACLPNDAGANNPTLVSNLMSDDCFGGGGINDIQTLDCDAFISTTEDQYATLWKTTYYGIFRCNMIIKRFEQAEYENDAQKGQDLGEALFLRAYFNFRLAQFWGTFPLKTEPDPTMLPKATPEEIFAFIASDLKKAVEIMPSTKYQSIDVSRLGHATKWAAEALMARVYLFYTGYYNKTDLPLVGGSSLSKAQVITMLDDCITNSGHGLLPEFRNNWPYAYANQDYPYAKNNGLEWVGEDGDNIETVFAIRYSPYGGWGEPLSMAYSNQLVLYTAMRGQNNLMPFGTGWGIGTVSPELWDSFDDADIRKKGSIVDVTDPEEGNVSTDYVWGVWECMHETGLWNKKYTPIQVPFVNSAGTDVLKGMFYVLYGTPDDYQRWNMQDEILIRFSDILLMAAELKGDAEPLNQVRRRVGLADVAYSLEALKNERRHELALEGLRYFDLLRWHDAESVFANSKDIAVKNLNLDATYTATFRPETGGFLPIPESQIRLSGGTMVQNPGWE